MNAMFVFFFILSLLTSALGEAETNYSNETNGFASFDVEGLPRLEYQGRDLGPGAVVLLRSDNGEVVLEYCQTWYGGAEVNGAIVLIGGFKNCNSWEGYEAIRQASRWAGLDNPAQMMGGLPETVAPGAGVLLIILFVILLVITFFCGVDGTPQNGDKGEAHIEWALVIALVALAAYWLLGVAGLLRPFIEILREFQWTLGAVGGIVIELFRINGEPVMARDYGRTCGWYEYPATCDIDEPLAEGEIVTIYGRFGSHRDYQIVVLDGGQGMAQEVES